MQTLRGKWGPQEEALMGLLVDFQCPLRAKEDRKAEEGHGLREEAVRDKSGTGQSPSETPSAHDRKGPLDITVGQHRPDRSGPPGTSTLVGAMSRQGA